MKNNLQKIRTEQAISIEELAERSACTSFMIEKIESGKHVPELGLKQRIANVLGSRISEIF